jgi:polysaccharide pyruvyl transferase WcaK-like protein
MSHCTILHVASHEINVGDGALIGGIRQAIREIAGFVPRYRPMEMTDFPARSGEVSPESLDAASADLILVGGGGSIDGRPSHSRSGMAFPLSGDEVRRLRTPLAYVALGVNMLPGERLHHSDRLADVLRACRDRGIPFSVRNDGSLARLRDAVGDAADAVVEVPDPGFFVEVDADRVIPSMSGHRPTVLVQVAGDHLDKRLGSKPHNGSRATNRWSWRRIRRSDTIDQFLADLAELVQWLVVELDAEVLLAPHTLRDVPVAGQLVARLQPGVCRRRVRVLGIAHAAHAPQYFAAYAKADLVVGMRGHSVICAVGLRRPCVALATHAKVTGFMQSCALGDWSISPSPDWFDRVRLACRQLVDSPETQLTVRDRATAGFRDRFVHFMRQCWSVRRRGATSLSVSEPMVKECKP